MKNTALLVALATLGFMNAAHADGFICEGANTGLSIKVFNHTQASEGTRTPAIMVISDPTIEPSRQTIASFTDENKTLAYQGYGSYLAKVDLRYTESSRAGENIAGTKLSDLKTIEVAIKFSYDSGTTVLAQTVDSIPGEVSYHKRNGEVLEETISCKRYLKN